MTATGSWKNSLHHLLRYAAAGGLVAVVYVGGTLLLSGPVGLPIQAAIPIAYVVAVVLHFLLQRTFVFRHDGDFALSVREQIVRYLLIAATQYPATAALTALLPVLFGMSDQVAYLITVALISLTFFFVLRWGVFHPQKGHVAGEQHPGPVG
jgi:putative flippase GtrA